MAKSMRSVLRLSLVMRNLSTLQSRSVSLRLFRTSTNPRTIDDRDTSMQFLNRFPEPSKVSLFTQQLRDCQTPEEVFNLMLGEPRRITGFGALKCLMTLFAMSKKNPQLNQRIPQMKEFGTICDTIKRDIRQLSNTNVINALKCLIYFRVPSATVLMQMLLQRIRDSVNSLSLEQLIFTKFLLTKCQKTPLVDVLNIALPIVFNNHVDSHLNTENLDSLISVLDYMKRMSIESDVLPRIVRAVQKFSPSTYTPNQAKNLLFCLLHLKPNEEVLRFIPKVQDVVAQNMDHLTEMELAVLMLKIQKHGMATPGPSNPYYHEGLVDAAAASVISKDRGFNVANHVLHYMDEMRHVNNALLDYIAAKCFEDPKLLRTATRENIRVLIKALSTADYKPIFWDSIKENLLKRELLESDLVILMQLALSLATLDFYWVELLTKIFETPQLRTLDAKNRKRLLLLYYATRNSCPEYQGPWPSDELLKILQDVPISTKAKYDLLPAIETAVGGSQYVITNLRTKFMSDMDHAVIMRKGGFPIAINCENEEKISSVEDLQPFKGNQVILFLSIPHYGYTRNTQRLTGYFSFFIRQIEAETKHTVIPIHLGVWKSMSEREQSRYISQAIRLKCDELSAVMN